MKMVKIVLAACSLFCAQFAFAGKVVVLDLQQAIFQTDVAQARQKAVLESAEYIGLRGEAESLMSELEALNKKAQSDGLTWSQDQIAEHKKKVEFVQGDYQRVVQKAKASEQAMAQGIVGAVKEEYITSSLVNIVKAEGIDLVLRKEASNYSTPESDITAKLVVELNKAIAAGSK